MELIEILEYLLEYYDKKLSDRSLEIYLYGLRDIPGDLLEWAARRWINTSAFMPRVNELRSLAEEIQQQDRYSALIQGFEEQEEGDEEEEDEEEGDEEEEADYE